MKKIKGRPAEILLIEDNPGDVLLTREAFADSKVTNNIHVAEDGDEALAYLRKEDNFVEAVTPDIILLDLNMPGKDGREVLAEIKKDQNLRRIPVVVVTSSRAEKDVVETYDLHANGYIQKPVDLSQFGEVVKAIENFWFTVVVLPEYG